MGLWEALNGILYQQPQGALAQPNGLMGALYENPLMRRQVEKSRAANPRPVLDTPQQALELGAGVMGPVPGLGDALGLAADLNRYRTEPESRTWTNFGLTGLGLLPLVPGMTGMKKTAVRDSLREKYPDARVFVSEGLSDPYNRQVWRLDDLVVPEEKRGQGVGTKIMEDLIKMADERGAILKLNPASPTDKLGTTSRDRLIEFYKRFGFIENKGRNADHAISEAMYRVPKGG